MILSNRGPSLRNQPPVVVSPSQVSPYLPSPWEETAGSRDEEEEEEVEGEWGRRGRGEAQDTFSEKVSADKKFQCRCISSALCAFEYTIYWYIYCYDCYAFLQERTQSKLTKLPVVL